MKRTRPDPAEVTVQVKGKNVVITPELRALVTRKMQRLAKYLDRLQQIEVELCSERTRDADQHCHVEATTFVLGHTIRVATDHAEMHAAVDEAVDKLYRQLNRQKERVKSHHGTRLADTVPVEAEEFLESANGAQASEPRVITELVDVEPMFEEEAVDALAETGGPLLVFLNARDEKVNVLYRREDGNFGLIEPRTR